ARCTRSLSMHSQQMPALVQKILLAVGSIATYLGLVSADQMGQLTSSILAIVGPLSTIATIAWSIAGKTQPKLVAAVNAMPEVKGVVTTDTTAGRELAHAVPSNTVVAAGTPAAAQIAQ